MNMTVKKAIALLLTVAGLLVLVSCNQEESTQNSSTDKKVYKIGITQYADHSSLDNCRKGFISGLNKNGFTQDDNMKIEFQSAQAEIPKATQIADNYASQKMDLVCGIATPSAQTLYKSCFDKNIPVIFNAVSDPVGASLAIAKDKNAKGVTGVSDLLPVEDQLKLIREILPNAKKIGIIYTTSEANSLSTIKIYKELAPKYGFEIIEKGITKSAEIPTVIDVILTQVDCISNLTDNTVVDQLALMLNKADEKKIPIFGSEEEQVKNGCIASAGLDYFSLGEKTGEMAARILKGEDINNIPFETLKESKITVNNDVAAKLNITIPESLKK